MSDYVDRPGEPTSSDDESARILREAFEARAHSAISEFRAIPPMRSSSLGRSGHRAPTSKRRRAAWLAPLAAAAVVAAVVIGTLALPGDTNGHGTAAGPVLGPSGAATSSGGTAPVGPAPSASPLPSSSSSGPVTAVRVTSSLGDGAVVGVGMPIVLSFSPSPTDSSAFTKAVTVTVNGQPVVGAWYWEKPYADEPLQAHFREQSYWPADATVQVRLPIGGLSAGKGLVYGSGLTSVTFHTGDAHVSTVDAQTLRMTVTDNGRPVKIVPVSLGAATTPTFNGVKVVMQKGEDVPGTDTLRANGTVMMSGPGYSNDPVPWSVRVTASGEYVHAAGWNTHIGVRSTSNGCTNLMPADGQWFYNFSLVGDVVKYVNTDGSAMNPLDGLGDWNVPWGLWSAGGQLLNH